MTYEQAMQIVLTLAEDGYKFWQQAGDANPDMIEAIHRVAMVARAQGIDTGSEGRSMAGLEGEDVR